MREYVFLQVDRKARDRLEEIRSILNKERIRPLDIDEVLEILLDLYDYKELEKEINKAKR